MSVGPAVVIIGIDGEPTSALASDIRRLSYRAHLVTWPEIGRASCRERV